jgi:hypothetical protein
MQPDPFVPGDRPSRGPIADIAALLGMTEADVRRAVASLKDEAWMDDYAGGLELDPLEVELDPLEVARAVELAKRRRPQIETDEYADLVETDEYADIMGEGDELN